MCVCVCVCVRARALARACVRVRAIVFTYIRMVLYGCGGLWVSVRTAACLLECTVSGD